MSCALGLLTVVALPAWSLAEVPDRADAAIPVWMLEEPTATPGDPALEAGATSLLEEASGTVCTEQCPGDLSRGIPPYTPDCSSSCSPCYKNGKICGFMCDGYGLHCFPDGCFGDFTCT